MSDDLGPPPPIFQPTWPDPELPEHQFESVYFEDEFGAPAGGETSGVGVEITWQNGPLGPDGSEREDPNGACVAQLLYIIKDRLDHYQEGFYQCRENAIALAGVGTALEALSRRDAARRGLGVEGRNVPTHRAYQEHEARGEFERMRELGQTIEPELPEPDASELSQPDAADPSTATE